MIEGAPLFDRGLISDDGDSGDAGLEDSQESDMSDRDGDGGGGGGGDRRDRRVYRVGPKGKIKLLTGVDEVGGCFFFPFPFFFYFSIGRHWLPNRDFPHSACYYY